MIVALLVSAGIVIAARPPGPDSTDNTRDYQVVGNKADTAATAVGTTTSVVAYVKGTYNYLCPTEITDTATVDISERNYAAWTTLLAVKPASGQGLNAVAVALDLNKATTGLDAVSTASDTIDAIAQVRVDGTNWRTISKATQVTTTGAGTLDAGINGMYFDCGPIGADGALVIKIKLNAERGDAQVPYRITYTAVTAPTVYNTPGLIGAAYQ